METDAERVAMNQVVFRDVNERVHALRTASAGRASDEGELEAFLCECCDDACFQKLWLTVPEYEAVRAHLDRFVTAPGHQVAEGEQVLAMTDRFAVVAKTGAAARVARARDPRS